MIAHDHSSRPVVLVIDAQPLHVSTYESVFERMGVECICVSEQGVRDFDEQQRCIGILLDLSARSADGAEAIGRLRQVPGLERTPLVLVTDAALEELSDPAVVGCLRPPLVPNLLLNKIAVLLELRASEHVIGSGTDVTSRNHAESEVQRLVEALNAEKEWLLAALNSIHDEVYFTDPLGRYTYANPAALREFGYVSVEGVPVEGILSNLVVLRSDGTPRPIEEAPPLRALKGEVVKDEGQIVRVPRTGELRHRQVSSAPVRSAEGKVIGSVSVVRDVTENKQAEARLREAVKQAQAAEAESRAALAAELTAMKRLHDLSTAAIQADDLQALLEEILDATIALHAADYGTIRLFDAQAETLRIAAQRGLEKEFLDRFAVVHCHEAPMWAAAMAQRERLIIEDVESAGQAAFLHHLARQIGSRALQSTPLFTAEGAPLGMLTTHFASPRRFSPNELWLTDLYARQAGIAIERKQAEAALITAHESADRANKAKSHFLRAASHDLRQPVQTLAMLNGILRSSEIDASVQAIVQQQAEAIDTMAHLLDALLNISKLESGVIRPEISDFPVEPLLSRLRLEFASLVASKGLELNIDCPGSPLMRSDPTLVGEILRNLLSNAIKFTSRGSITLRCMPDGETVKLEVVDSGVGIPRDELPLIFGEFYQVGVGATVSRQGYGLGLGIVQRMASMLQVRIDVESEVGKGSRFSLAVPAGDLQAPGQSAATRMRQNLAPPATPSTILLVEDHAALRNAMERFFKMKGYRIISADSVDQTLALIRESPPPELLITDFHLPGGTTGSEVISSVRKVLGESFPAIMLSGDTSAEVSDLANDARVRFASKPIDPDDLIGLVQELLVSGLR